MLWSILDWNDLKGRIRVFNIKYPKLKDSSWPEVQKTGDVEFIKHNVGKNQVKSILVPTNRFVMVRDGAAPLYSRSHIDCVACSMKLWDSKSLGSKISGHSIISGTSIRRRPESSVIYPSTSQRHLGSGFRRSDENTAMETIGAFYGGSEAGPPCAIMGPI